MPVQCSVVASSITQSLGIVITVEITTKPEEESMQDAET